VFQTWPNRIAERLASSDADRHPAPAPCSPRHWPKAFIFPCSDSCQRGERRCDVTYLRGTSGLNLEAVRLIYLFQLPCSRLRNVFRDPRARTKTRTLTHELRVSELEHPKRPDFHDFVQPRKIVGGPCGSLRGGRIKKTSPKMQHFTEPDYVGYRRPMSGSYISWVIPSAFEWRSIDIFA